MVRTLADVHNRCLSADLRLGFRRFQGASVSGRNPGPAVYDHAGVEGHTGGIQEESEGEDEGTGEESLNY